MPAEKIPMSNEEIIALLQHRAKDQEAGDCFRVKVKRLASTGGGYLNGQSQHLCTLKDAMVVHLANPETWVPLLAGGGNYALSVYGAESTVLQIGHDIKFSYTGAPPKELDFEVTNRPDWPGPTITWPDRPLRQQNLPSLVTLAPQASSQGTAPLTSSPGATSPGGQSVFGQQQAANPGFDLLQQIQARERELVEREARMREEIMRKETEMNFARMKADLEAQRAQMKSELDAARAREVAPRGPSMIEQLVPALTPIITMMMQQQQSMREMMMKQQELAQTRQDNMMQLVLARPAMDPMLEKMMERIQPKDNTSSAEMLVSVTDTIRNMTSMAMDAVAQASELQGGNQKENIPMMVVREIARAVESLGQAGNRAVMARAPMPPPRPVQMRQQPQIGNNATAAGPQVPAQQFNGVPQHAQQPAQAAAPVQQVPHSRMGPQPQRDQTGNLIFNSVPDALEFMIRNHHEPADVVAFLGNNLMDSTLQVEFNAASGSVFEFLERRLGPSWPQENAMNHPYLQNLIGLVQADLTRRGIVQPEQVEEPAQEQHVEDAQFEEPDNNGGDEIAN